MSAPRLLVAEGNTAEGRAGHAKAGGVAMSEGYARVLRDLLPSAVVDICYPADAGANLPDRAGLESYDGVAITGSALNVYDGGPPVDSQVALARAVMAARTPVFGSCWGLQVLTVAAGGSVRKNPKGREIGFARRIRLTQAGREHPMFERRRDAFDALTVHLDEVETLPLDTTVLATNAVSDVQAFEIRRDGAVAWAVQYHPEYSPRDMAVIVRRYGNRLVKEGFFADSDDLFAHATDLELLDREPGNTRLAWRYGLDGDVLDKDVRRIEIANWIAHQVLPTRAARGRG
jgi:GMP synthase (glutamine-hydrolysing)